MSRRAITNFCVIPAALFLLLIGILHGIVNVSMMRRAIERGQISARLGNAALPNAAFSGAAMSIFGLLVLLVLPGLRNGSRQASRVATVIGVVIGVVGAVGYLWAPPPAEAILIFLFFGALLAAPLLIWRREFSNP